MKIAYYMPFKPLGHPNPSGDLVFGTELYDHLNQTGHECRLASSLRCRWIYLHPLRLCTLLQERLKVLRALQHNRPDIWLSYHSYYKAPDLLGPYVSRKLAIPYVIFQGIYSTKRRRQLKTMPGFYLNRHALTSANLVFTNKKRDRLNLLRLLPEKRVCYIAPGIHTADFTFDRQSRHQLRDRWRVTDETVILTAAMFRPGVKTRGLEMVIRSCADILRNGRRIKLVIAGDGKTRDSLRQFAYDLLAGSVEFCGRIPRNELYRVYSAADIFAFPGIEESLGMVYLEAQSCGLPVVALADWGGREAVIDGSTGLLSPAANPERFTENIDHLITHTNRRKDLGRQAARHARNSHELAASYRLLSTRLAEIAAR